MNHETAITEVALFPDYTVDTEGTVYSKEGRPLRPSVSRGYKRVRLYGSGERHDRYVHVIVLESFVGPSPSKRHQGCHGDGDRANNDVTNLSWRTRHENAADRRKHGTQKSANGAAHPNAKLTESDVRDIHLLRQRGLTYAEIQENLAACCAVTISRDRIGEICRGKAWRHLEDPMKNQPIVPLKVVRLDESVPLPEYKTEHAAGLDLCSADNVTIAPGETAKIRTGLRLEIPTGYFGLITPRSGLAVKHGVTVLNTPGTIDSDYRGELHVILHNVNPPNDGGGSRVAITKGQRIAQLIILPQPRVELLICASEDLSETARGTGGFGSTGD